MTIGERITLFIESCYQTQTKYAELVKLNPSSLNRYVRNKCAPTLDILEKFKSTGMSIDWLIDGKGSMFAQSEEGDKLKDKYHISKSLNSNPSKLLNRLKTWIFENYENLDNLCQVFQADYLSLSNVIFSKTIPDTTFFSIMEEAGCNMNWIIKGEGDCYNDTFTGMILKIKRDGVKDFNGVMEESTITMKELNEAKTKNDLLSIIRKAIRIELRRNNEHEK
jgi:transcriptional regulator with XRE-family HTH domain